MDDTSIPLDRLARVYRKISAVMQDLTRKYEAEFEALNAQRKEVSLVIKDQMLALGSKSIRTDEGTIILSQKTHYRAQDWDAFKTFVLENQALDLFERRIAQSNMSKFLEANPGVVPPGLNAETEFVVAVRKPN